jgi:hypothetical protein
VLTTILELVCVALVSLFLFAVWPPAVLLPWAAIAGLMAWSRR